MKLITVEGAGKASGGHFGRDGLYLQDRAFIGLDFARNQSFTEAEASHPAWNLKSSGDKRVFYCHAIGSVRAVAIISWVICRRAFPLAVKLRGKLAFLNFIGKVLPLVLVYFPPSEVSPSRVSSMTTLVPWNTILTPEPSVLVSV